MRCVHVPVLTALATRSVLDQSCHPRLCAAGGGADRRMQGQEQLERPALAARAAGPGRAVNIVADEHCHSCLLHGLQWLCGTAVQAPLYSLTAQAGPTRPSRSGRAVPAACTRVCEVVW